MPSAKQNWLDIYMFADLFLGPHIPPKILVCSHMHGIVALANVKWRRTVPRALDSKTLKIHSFECTKCDGVMKYYN
jgi:hypothetical protein